MQSLIAAKILNALAVAFFAGNSGFSENWPIIIKLLVLQFVCIIVTGLISNLKMIIVRTSGELVANHVNVKIITKAKETDLASFDNPDFYEKLENARREASMRPIQILNSVFSVISTLISMFSFIAILWAVSPVAPLLIFALSIPTAVISFVYRKKNFLYIRRRSKDRRQLNYYSERMTDKDNAKEVRIFGLADLFIDRYKSVFKKYYNGLKSLFIKEGAWNTGMAVVTAAVNCFLFLYIARKVCLGETQVGDYSLYTGALNSISACVASFISVISTIYEGTLFIDNIIAFMKEKKTIVPLLKEPLHVKRHVGHSIKFENVSFRYPGTNRDVIKNINAEITPGSTVVLVGLNGAGKTTLIKLITRLYDPTEGRILLDGTDIRNYSTEELYSIFGIIFQDFGKYAVSVKENIAFGQIDEPVDENKIVNSAVQSNSDVFINNLPLKYDTPLMKYFEEDGIELSIGQWQKLSVARAFYSNSDILILDEPTASLDAIAEQEIYSQFDSLRQGKTTIFVSHRLSSATTAEKILVLDNGQLIEEGSHTELMRKKGQYWKLFSTQAKRYLEETNL